MPELLLQSAFAASKTKELVAEAAEIKANCHAQHGDNKSLISCPQCYGALLEALRTRYTSSAISNTSSTAADLTQPQQQQQQQQQRREWFTSRLSFLSALDSLISSAKEYRISPQATDDCVMKERSRWYAENVRGTLLRLMVDDPEARTAVFEKLEDPSSTTGEGSEAVALAREVAEFLTQGPLPRGQAPADLPQRLAAAGDDAGKLAVLKEVFFKSDGSDDTVPDDHQKYLDLLLQQGLSMEQVVDRILEDRQAATGAREHANQLNQRLDDLRRARAAHEAQKSRKAKRRESIAQQKVPDELYELPACAVCGEIPRTDDFFACSICTILAGAGVREQQTVFCSEKCEEQGQVSAPSGASTTPHLTSPIIY